MDFFFQEDSGRRNLHQDEKANTLVYLCLEKFEEGSILVGNPPNPFVNENPERQDEAKRLHLALKVGQGMSDNILDALVDSLILHVNGELPFSERTLIGSGCYPLTSVDDR